VNDALLGEAKPGPVRTCLLPEDQVPTRSAGLVTNVDWARITGSDERKRAATLNIMIN